MAWVLTLKLQLTVGLKFDHDYPYQWMKDLEAYEGSLEGSEEYIRFFLLLLSLM
jgi:hypothetical protein